MNHAQCLCGAVSWEIDGPLEWMSHCHCSRCRKAHGAAFATYVSAPAAGFRLHVAIIPMGSLDDDPGLRPQAHIFVGSMAPWYAIGDDLPQHVEYPPAA